MKPRIFHLLLIAAVLLILTACGTTTPRPDDGSLPVPGTEQVPAWEDTSEERYRDPADWSLPEVEALSAGMSYYQPDLALDILRSLESIPSGELKTLIDHQFYDPEFTEWLELALQTRSAAISGDPGPAAAKEWAKYHYGHVVGQSDFSGLVNSYRALFPTPTKVAVLLPTQGSLSGAAKAIRDGIMSAYLNQPNDAVIRFYSSGQNSESAIAAYQQASYDGAMHIIGPLNIESTRTIATLPWLTTPVLLLNGMAGNMEQPDRVNSLSLSTTEEATAIAIKALAQGQRTAITLVPDSARGQRIEEAFSTAFVQGGGQIKASRRFDPRQGDHSALLTQVLKIDESKQRKTDLQSWLGVPLSFEPSRFHDFDFFFMAANPVEGRKLKPLLRFHDAGDVPVYAMGRIYSGRTTNTSDQDLDGVVFPTSRLQLRSAGDVGLAAEMNSLASVRGGAYGNLYALGQDAWRLLPWLPLMQKDPDLWFPGEVGALRLQADGSLRREPAWAQFSAGKPIEYHWQPAEDAPGNE